MSYFLGLLTSSSVGLENQEVQRHLQFVLFVLHQLSSKLNPVRACLLVN